jgi:hypothetical protein
LSLHGSSTTPFSNLVYGKKLCMRCIRDAGNSISSLSLFQTPPNAQVYLHEIFTTVNVAETPSSSPTKPLASICFFHLVDSYLAVMTVSWSSDSSPFDSEAKGTGVKVQRPKAQLRIYLARPSGASRFASCSGSEDCGGSDAYSIPLMRYTSSFVGSSRSLASLLVSTLPRLS